MFWDTYYYKWVRNDKLRILSRLQAPRRRFYIWTHGTKNFKRVRDKFNFNDKGHRCLMLYMLLGAKVTKKVGILWILLLLLKGLQIRALWAISIKFLLCLGLVIEDTTDKTGKGVCSLFLAVFLFVDDWMLVALWVMHHEWNSSRFATIADPEPLFYL